jgi:hypothetical protein
MSTVLEMRPGILISTADEAPAAWASIDAYPLDRIRNHLVRKGMNEAVAEQSIAELRRFFKLIALGYESVGMTSETVDEAWHTLILHTAEYANFCDDVFGRFIHHRPMTPEDDGGPAAAERFREAYTRTFHEPPPVPVHAARCDPDCST